MEHKITFHDDYVEIRAWGKAKLQGFVDYVTAAIEDPRWRPGLNVFVDLSELEELDTEHFSFDDVSRYASFLGKKSTLIGDGKIAAIAARNLDSKVLISLLDSLAQYRGINISHKVVKDRAEAMAWLKETQPSH